MNYKSLETERLIIRPTEEQDADFIFTLMNSPLWLKYIGDRNISSVEVARDYINNKIRTQLARLGFANFTIIRKEDGAKIGSCGLYDRDGLKDIDIGYAFLPEYMKMGYAYEAASTVLKAAFEDFDLTTVCAITNKENIGSQKLLEKLGLTLTGTTLLPNESQELLLFKISR